MNKAHVRLLIRNLEVADTNENGDRVSGRYCLMYLTGSNLSESFEVGSMIAECSFFHFEREREGFVYVDSLALEKIGETYRVCYILR